MNQKGLAPILIFFLIALGLGGYFVYTNYSNNHYKVSSQPTSSSSTADENTDWKSYTNSKGNYSFKYPVDFYVEESNNAEDGFVYNRVTIYNKAYKDFVDDFNNHRTSVLNPDDNETFLMSIVIPPEKNNSSLEMAKKEYGIPGNQSVDYTIDGIKGFRVVNGDTVVVYKGQEYYFQLRNYNNKYASYFDKILSTFKFTDQNQSNETANWKTYTNSKYGFTFKYPSDYKSLPNLGEHVFYSPDAEFDKNTNAKIKGIEIGSTVYGQEGDQGGDGDIENYKGPNTKTNSSIISKMILPTGAAAKTYVNPEDITVTIDYKKDNKDTRIMIWCGGEKGNTERCEEVLTPLLSTFKFN